MWTHSQLGRIILKVKCWITSSVVFWVPHYSKDLENIKRAIEMIKEPQAVIKRWKDLLRREKMMYKRHSLPIKHKIVKNSSMLFSSWHNFNRIKYFHEIKMLILALKMNSWVPAKKKKKNVINQRGKDKEDGLGVAADLTVKVWRRGIVHSRCSKSTGSK